MHILSKFPQHPQPLLQISIARGTCLPKITYPTAMTSSHGPISTCHCVHSRLDFVLLASPLYAYLPLVVLSYGHMLIRAIVVPHSSIIIDQD
ncbi:hypothetical protein BD311DRAFT_524276 [Dichomitus squalens]|uniref:Uncharacterized protein n=1 Tax=Dichomitus squalens TaxID=114155 RepID=A0A4Q9MGR8_9APHY|nr:hypothetical protein BD311DRAFT_524276 [Dichomitus squalens]